MSSFFRTLGSLGASEWWVIATAVCCAVACAVLGCFLVLRRMSMLGDAISHAVLPGLAVAFLFSGTRDLLPMLAGAMGVGLLTAFFSAGLARWGRVPEDAAMGVVFTSFFALGVILVTWVARDVDLDPGCVLYGLLEFVPLDPVRVGPVEMPRAFASLAIILTIDLVAVALFFKELKIVAFDPYLATTMGISATLVHYGLMTLVAATTVASFEAVGSILVVAMLIAPGATAHMLTDRLSRMLWVSAAVAALAAFFGYVLALHFNSSAAGMMSVVAGGEFVLAALLGPRHGVASKLLHRAALSLRIAREDVLGMLYRWHESVGAASQPTPLTVADIQRATLQGPIARLAVWDLERRGSITHDRAGGLALTDRGQSAARLIVRSHRLWESYLSKHLGLPPDHLHEPSHRVEHFITPALRAELGEEIQESRDPHGKDIPG